MSYFNHAVKNISLKHGHLGKPKVLLLYWVTYSSKDANLLVEIKVLDAKVRQKIDKGSHGVRPRM